jgi:hypothetical protein
MVRLCRGTAVTRIAGRRDLCSGLSLRVASISIASGGDRFQHHPGSPPFVEKDATDVRDESTASF